MRVSVEPGESSVRVKKNGAEVGVARPGAEINEALSAGDTVELEAFDEPAAEEAEAAAEGGDNAQEGTTAA
jgi:hypothetical protein